MSERRYTYQDANLLISNNHWLCVMCFSAAGIGRRSHARCSFFRCVSEENCCDVYSVHTDGPIAILANVAKQQALVDKIIGPNNECVVHFTNNRIRVRHRETGWMVTSMYVCLLLCDRICCISALRLQDPSIGRRTTGTLSMAAAAIRFEPFSFTPFSLRSFTLIIYLSIREYLRCACNDERHAKPMRMLTCEYNCWMLLRSAINTNQISWLEKNKLFGFLCVEIHWRVRIILCEYYGCAATASTARVHWSLH